MFYKKAIFGVSAVLLGAATVYFFGNLQNKPTHVLAHTEHSHQHPKEEVHEEHEDDVINFTEQQIQELGFKFLKAKQGNLLFSFSTPGKIIIQPDRLAHIIPKVSGIAKEANKNVGNYVRKNDMLAVLESNDIADIKASYLASLSKQRLAAATLEREERLYQEKVSAGQDYLNARNQFEEANINVQLAIQKLGAFGLKEEEISQLVDQKDLRLYTIRSPIFGTVIMRHITMGEYIENTRTIYEIADLSTVWVEIGIYPKDLYRVKEGQVVDVVIPVENIHAQAKIIYVSPIIAEETITAKAVAELDNSEGVWRPGVFVKVNILTEKALLPLVIPKEAVQNIEGSDVVFVVTANGFEKRAVKLGQSDQENVEVVSGLKENEQYVANNTFLLKAELGKNTAEHEH